jgi:hypothetical protein
MRHFLASTAAMLVATLLSGAARADSKPDPWTPFRFLIGEWIGEGDGAPGKGSGGFTLAADLDGKVLVRRNRAEYQPSAGSPAVVHQDLMVIYPQATKDKGIARASYWDNEGHVIQYSVWPAKEGTGLVFLSEAVKGEPRFRLSYAKGEKDSVTLKFEIAPPDKPDTFKTYIDAKVRRKESLPLRSK